MALNDSRENMIRTALGVDAGREVIEGIQFTQDTTATATELNYLDITTLGTGAASKAVVLDASSDYIWPDAGTLTIGNTATTVESAEHGAGAIGTSSFGAPQTYRWIENGIIITQIKFDITGLAVKGDAANDVIGLAAGGAAYIGRNVVASNGVIFRAELSCIEVPGEGTATITQDIDIATNSSAVLAYDGDAGAARLFNTAALVAGETIVNNAPALTANDYYYIVEADAAAATGVYNAGQFILTTYGHALLA
jgi:hypothetical protein